ncbi:MAG TPA: protein phosphatase 2C domain-containing protein [Phycisphaerae bacterium]|nr:protein phosphatase 2C domain-containing protein [Phycisphaerae bacterium]
MTQMASHTDIGHRANLEDTARAIQLRKAVPRKIDADILILADGAGGHQCGEVASTLGVDVVSSVLVAQLVTASDEAVPRIGGGMTGMIEAAVVYANEAVVERAAGSNELSGMASTVVCIVIRDGVLYVAWAGDSRGYLYGDGRLRRITHDHSPVQRLIDLGLVNPAEVQSHPLSHIIDRYLGQPQGFVPEIGTYRILPGNVVLVCSDGLTDVLSDDEIANHIRFYQIGRCTFEELPVRLVEAALAAGTTDNVTVLCCEYEPAVFPLAHPTEVTLTGAYPVALSETFRATKEIDHAASA